MEVGSRKILLEGHGGASLDPRKPGRRDYRAKVKLGVQRRLAQVVKRLIKIYWGQGRRCCQLQVLKMNHSVMRTVLTKN